MTLALWDFLWSQECSFLYMVCWELYPEVILNFANVSLYASKGMCLKTFSAMNSTDSNINITLSSWFAEFCHIFTFFCVYYIILWIILHVSVYILINACVCKYIPIWTNLLGFCYRFLTRSLWFYFVFTSLCLVVTATLMRPHYVNLRAFFWALRKLMCDRSSLMQSKEPTF